MPNAMIFDYKLVHKGANYYKIDLTKIARRIKYPVAIVKCQLTICEAASSSVYNSALKRRLFIRRFQLKPGAHTSILVGRFKFRCMILANLAM